MVKQERQIVPIPRAFSVSSSPFPPKAEFFKRWLAKVGYERIQKIEKPELTTKRTKALYRAKGYSEAWIEKQNAQGFPGNKTATFKGGKIAGDASEKQLSGITGQLHLS